MGIGERGITIFPQGMGPAYILVEVFPFLILSLVSLFVTYCRYTNSVSFMLASNLFFQIATARYSRINDTHDILPSTYGPTTINVARQVHHI